MAEKSVPQYKIVISKDGPYLVSGRLPLAGETIVTDDQGVPVKWGMGKAYPDSDRYCLCRCGQSRKMPFCDGAHVKEKFDGTETAKRADYMAQAETIHGPGVDLTDVESLCCIARFCHQGGDTWSLVERSDDPEAKRLAVKGACDCPAGRLIAWEKNSGQPIEPELLPSIGLVEDPAYKVSGPIYVKGGIPIVSADGFQYEIRNRVTLCRCGRSENKPFCDGTHIDVKFKAGA